MTTLLTWVWRNRDTNWMPSAECRYGGAPDQTEGTKAVHRASPGDPTWWPSWQLGRTVMLTPPHGSEEVAKHLLMSNLGCYQAPDRRMALDQTDASRSIGSDNAHSSSWW